MECIDLRSDTVTSPSPEMRQAMAAAPVGDDQYGEDPTVNRLQDRVAGLLGKEAALFVPSGTMANQIGLKILTRPGDEVVVGDEAHIVCVALSKGLGCPVGSLVVGRHDDIARAKRVRRMFGGAMRQSGILAAAG